MADPLLVRFYPPPNQAGGISHNTDDGSHGCQLAGKLFFEHPGRDIQYRRQGIYEGDDR